MPETRGDASVSNVSQPPRVLVVDDDKAIRSLVATVLSKRGYSIEIARNGEEALAAIADCKFEVIILDLMMPKVDGFEVIEHLARTTPETLTKCVIVLTAVASRELRKLDSSRVFRVIRKPFDLEELVSAVTECVEGKDA